MMNFKETQSFDGTPSFYKNLEAFAYLGLSSYYQALQDNILKIIGLISPRQVLELGSALGNTLIRYARVFPDIEFEGCDMRTDVVAYANACGVEAGLSNVTFRVEDMQNTVLRPLSSDVIFMLYAFHHIPDPEQNKVCFLKNAYMNMKDGSYLCIAETFIPSGATGLQDKDSILKLWKHRSLEGYASTFWHALDGISAASIQKAREAGLFSEENESLAGELVAKREEEYLVTNSWLLGKAREIGFDIILNEPVNALAEYIVVLRK